jgi:hypothetical protein
MKNGDGNDTVCQTKEKLESLVTFNPLNLLQRFSFKGKLVGKLLRKISDYIFDRKSKSKKARWTLHL